MTIAEAKAAKNKAQEIERRGDVIIQITQTSWDGYFKRQTFLNALGNTGTKYPTIVIIPDDFSYDSSHFHMLLRDDPQYQDPGILITAIIPVYQPTPMGETTTRVQVLDYLKPQGKGI